MLSLNFNYISELNLNVNILGDEDEASQWKDTNGSSDILTQNDDDWEQETESQEVEVGFCLKMLCLSDYERSCLLYFGLVVNCHLNVHSSKDILCIWWN